MEVLEEERDHRQNIIVGGDFNARTGREGGGVREREGEWEEKGERRRSKDRGTKMEKGWWISWRIESG